MVNAEVHTALHRIRSRPVAGLARQMAAVRLSLIHIFGKLGKPNQPNTTFVQTQLTPDEQYTHVTLWCLLSAPLIICCDLEPIDSFTMGLLTNDEVIAVDQDPAARPARKAWQMCIRDRYTPLPSSGTASMKVSSRRRLSIASVGCVDVYKRQEDFRAVAQGFPEGGRALGHDHEFLEVNGGVRMSASIDDVHPVSYTHLDVYKRQGGCFSVAVEDYQRRSSCLSSRKNRGARRGYIDGE